MAFRFGVNGAAAPKENARPTTVVLIEFELVKILMTLTFGEYRFQSKLFWKF